ncbi:MAG: hypothetical protein JWM07_596 [Candidatus Saccharibacteria bacterium]|nr:hypothetical protein [Candidatus Saccharibacteria bacterium]
MIEKAQLIALGIIRRDEDVLLIERRKKESGTNHESLNWVFPGGKVESGESPFASAEREVFEETGYSVQAVNQLDEHQHPSFPAHIHYIACRLAESTPQAVDDSGVMQVKWIPIAKLGIYITSSLNEHVSEYLTAQNFEI